MCGANKRKVFIAEDDVIIRMTIRMILEKNGYEVCGEAEDGKTALDKILELRPGLILTDLNMPEMNGLAMLKRVNAEYSVPSIIITGYFKKDLVEKAGKLGVSAYLMKPIDENQIMAAVEIAVKKYEEYEALKTEAESSKKALEDRKYIERAKGILMRQRDISEEEAMKFLQKKSRDKNMKLIKVAQEIIKMEELLGD